MTTIQKLKLHGFKSFPKSIEIVFPSGYSTIIGANGAGKSNLVDAFCFVFGKGSAKGLRAEKSANLIYNGGKKGKPMKEAEVSIWFDNKGKEFSIPEKEVKISRIVKENGSSIYKINDKTRNRQEVLDLLSSARIDPDGHNIILQGDIVRFMELKQDQRREVMEEISGISVYEDKKQKALNDLEKVEGKLREADIIFTERKAHLRELKNERDQALKYREVENEIKSNKATYIHVQIKHKSENKEEIEKRIKEQESGISKIQSNIDGIKKIINEKKDEIKKINEEIEKKGEKEQLKIHKEVEELKTSLLIKEIKDFREKHNIKDLDDVRNKLDKLNQEKNELLRQKDKIEFELSKFSESEFKDVGKLKDEFKSITNELNNCLKNDDKYIVELSRVRKRLVESNEELARLNIENLSYMQTTFDSLSIKRVLESGIKGIHNIVSELGRVDKKYSLAMEVAAGSRLKSIVVDDDIIAQKCINFLKEKRLGVCTFLPLNKINSRTPSDISNIKGVHGLAVSIIKYDNAYKNIFNYVFSDTLVVDDIETARRIGIGKTRMVTLEGDLMESSGAMVGGHRQRSAYSFKEINFDSKIEKLELEINELKKKVDDYENLKVSNDNRIYDLKKKKADLEAQLIKFGKLFDGSVNKSDLDSKIKGINPRLSAIEKEIFSLTRELESSKETNVKGLESLEQKRNDIKEKIIHIESDTKNFSMQISSILIPEREKILSILKNNDKEVEEFNNELKSLANEVKAMGVDLKGKEKIERSFYDEFKSLFGKKNKIQEFIQNKENDLIREEEKIRNVQQKVNSISLERAKITAEIEGLEKEFEPFKNEKIRRNIGLDDIKYEIQRLEKEFQKFGNVNLRALEIYEDLEKEFEKLTEKYDKLKVEKEDVLVMMNEIDSRKKDLFMKTFNVINKKFIDIFSTLSDKGQAYMELEDPENPFEQGIDIRVKLPGNRFMDIKSLSGGEKTLTTLAFIFAIQEFQPASFYLLDEVDAALDKH